MIFPSYATSGRRGRPPVSMPTMLHIHFIRPWYALSGPAMKSALCEIEWIRRIARIELNENAIPDEKTILKFRRFLEQHGLAVKVLKVVTAHIGGEALPLRRETIVDTTIIHSPSSTNGKDKSRGPEMHQTRKGNQWFFGMKAHSDIDLESRLVYTVTTTLANAAGVTELEMLLQGCKQTVYAPRVTRAKRSVYRKRATWRIAARRGSVKALPERRGKEAARHVEYLKPAVRSKVERPCRVMKPQFGPDGSFQKTVKERRSSVDHVGPIEHRDSAANAAYFCRRGALVTGEIGFDIPALSGGSI